MSTVPRSHSCKTAADASYGAPPSSMAGKTVWLLNWQPVPNPVHALFIRPFSSKEKAVLFARQKLRVGASNIYVQSQEVDAQGPEYMGAYDGEDVDMGTGAAAGRPVRAAAKRHEHEHEHEHQHEHHEHEHEHVTFRHK